MLAHVPTRLLAATVAATLALTACSDPTAPTTQKENKATRANLATATCTRVRQDIPASANTYLRLTRRSDGRVIHLRKGIYNHYPTVHVWEQLRYSGQWYIPVDVYDIQVRLERRLMTEIWMGQVRQTYKNIPVARYCPTRWSVAKVY